ncbi:MAG: hypothetical protein KGK00_13785, partial [Paracoccaceae bacterium]|nr:hypothetical protein [Paracoccaceae bacterium]
TRRRTALAYAVMRHLEELIVRYGPFMSFSHDEALLICVATSCVRIAVRRRPQHRLTGLGEAPDRNGGKAPLNSR